MKTIMLALLILTATAPTEAQQVVACKKMGDFSGQVYYFENSCPIGYYNA